MIEVIVFGKGYGESILLHINEKWIVVDSFVEPKSQMPIAIKYLLEKGHKIDEIAGVICTHWDNDHVLGMSKIIESHGNGLAVCLPIVYNDRRFLEYIAFNSHNEYHSTSEFYKVLKMISEKKADTIYAISERNLFYKEINDPTICLKALSPNDHQYKVFLDSISIPKKGERKREIPLEENKISVVTYLKTCVDSILLGGDMENSLDGWGSICESFIDKKCGVFKIPHHGSKNGFNAPVWKTMVDKPISVITRFNISNLPTSEMLEKIAQESSSVYVVGGKPKKDKESIRQINKFDDPHTVQSLSMIDSECGYVRLAKVDANQEWTVEVNGAVEKYA